MQSHNLSASPCPVKGSTFNFSENEVIAADLQIAQAVPTPRSNRGVVISVSIDWLTLSVSGVSLATWLLIVRDLSWLLVESKEAIFGHGYDCKVCAGYGSIGRRKNKDGTFDGIVNLNGEAMRHLAASGWGNWKVLRALVRVPGGSLTRTDFALDVFSDRVTVGRWWQKIEQGPGIAYATRARGVPRVIAEPSWAGGFQTIYIGSKSSPRMLRIYDKTQEQRAKAKSPPPENWTRIELQCRKQAAQAAGVVVAEAGLKAIAHLIGGFFRFIDDAEWTEIVDGSISLSLPGRPATTPEKTLKWICSRQSGIAKALHFISLCGLDVHVQEAKDGTEETLGDLRRWVNAFSVAS